MAVKAALFNTQVPRVTAALMDGVNVDLTLSDDPFDCEQLKIENVPLLVTICKIGNQCVVDPSAEEEICSTASLVVGVSIRDDKGKSYPIFCVDLNLKYDFFVRVAFITNIHTTGFGSFHSETINRGLELGISAARSLDKELMRTLSLEVQDHNKAVYGFLK